MADSVDNFFETWARSKKDELISLYRDLMQIYMKRKEENIKNGNYMKAFADVKRIIEANEEILYISGLPDTVEAIAEYFGNILERISNSKKSQGESNF